MPFPADTYAGASFAEATYGTKLFYRDVGIHGPDPNYSLGSFPSTASQKAVDLMAWLSAGDPSKLPWNDAGRYSTCYSTYWSGLTWSAANFYTVWLPAEEAATQLMLADPNCRPV